MKFMLALLALAYVVLASPTPSLPVHPGVGGFYRGPNSETIIKGPDGSVITSAAQGGAVQTKLEPIVVAEPAVVQEVVPVAIAAPVVESKQSSDLIGPSGRISTHGSQSIVAGPASTTITGPAVVAETVVKGAPIIAASPIAVTATPIVTGVSVAPVSITAAPIATIAGSSLAPLSITADLAPVSVTAAPVVTGAQIATVTRIPPVATATAKSSPHLSVASASSSSPGAVATASASPNVATASIETNANIASIAVTPLPPISPTVVPVISNGIAGHGIVGINDQIALGQPQLGVQLSPDQIAIDNRQIGLNPALIPSANIIPPEIGVTARPTAWIPSSTLIPPQIDVTPRGIGTRPINNLIPQTIGQTPQTSRLPNGEILTTPGLGAIASTTNIQREDVDARISVTPNTLQLSTPGGLTQEQAIALQNQQILLNNQIQNIQATDPRLLSSNQQVINVTPRNNLLLSNADPRLGGKPTLAQVQQEELLNVQLAQAGIDPSQLQLTNVPLSAASPLNLNNQINLKGGIITNDGLSPEAWGRYGREAKDKKN